jgi:hypothetical protein
MLHWQFEEFFVLRRFPATFPDYNTLKTRQAWQPQDNVSF